MKFFAPNSGGAPQIWATGGVSGTYSANPQGQTAAMTGGGLQADFTMKTWQPGTSGQPNKWLSTISNGAGNLSGGSFNGGINFRGAGAGTFGGGTFGGTAAGVAKAAAAP